MNGELDTSDVTVAICTFRRPTLETTLRSLTRQALPEGLGLRVVVADNDEDDRRRAEIEALGSELGLALRYVHAPARNISIARNACLDSAATRWLTFIDDDEAAEPDWLLHLLAHRDACEMVFGLCQAAYPDDAPRWIARGDFHSNRIAGNDASWNGYTANVLIDLAFVRRAGLRYATELGTSGGEDTMFFFKASRAGGRFAYEPEAKVTEPAAPARLKLGWLIRRRFRSGQVHYRILKELGQTGSGAGAALAKAAACGGLAVATIGNPVRWRNNLMRGALHAGVVAAAFGFSLYQEYAAPKRG
jgi:succinoglycan biosynthesis protein ExoM